MSVKTKMTIEVDGGDLRLFNDVFQQWNFKDEQSLLRFFLLIATKSDDKSMTVKELGELKTYVPANQVKKQVC